MVILVCLVVTLHEPMCNQESAHFRNQPSRWTNGMTKIRYDRVEGPIRDRAVTRYSTLTTDTFYNCWDTDEGTNLSKTRTKMFLRALEIIFFFYFLSHIPITLMIDLQPLLPEHLYPSKVSLHLVLHAH